MTFGDQAHYIMGSAFVRTGQKTPAKPAELDHLLDRICVYPGHHAPVRLGLAQEERAVAGVLRQFGHLRMGTSSPRCHKCVKLIFGSLVGYRQHVYRASRRMEQELESQG
jgi:hypothetical protein